MKKRILIIEDDKDIVEAVRYNLEKERGFSVLSAKTGDEGLNLVPQMKPHLIILDIGLPGLTGYEVCRMLRRDAETQDIPIVMLTARGSESDKVLGLELGADDYITKPFSTRELILRVKKILLRGQAAGQEPAALTFGDLLIDEPRHLVSWRKKQIDLTATEFKLLTLLAQRRGRVQSREQLLRDVWEYNNLIDTRTVDTHMRRLREKLGPAAKYLDTVRGVGYRFVEA